MNNPTRPMATGVPNDSDAAHRFRTVITTTQGYAELLHRRLAEPNADTELLARTLDRLLAELTRLTRLVEEQFGIPALDDQTDAVSPNSPNVGSDTAV